MMNEERNILKEIDKIINDGKKPPHGNYALKYIYLNYLKPVQ